MSPETRIRILYLALALDLAVLAILALYLRAVL